MTPYKTRSLAEEILIGIAQAIILAAFAAAVLIWAGIAMGVLV